ncbi:MAG: hypothetical protein ACXWE9_12355 [Methylobacter sp.]
MAIIICNFEESLTEELQHLLGSKSTDCSNLLRQFFNIKKKNIIPQPRQVHISKEIREHNLFNYEKKSVIQEIINRIKCGIDLKIYLSDRQNELDHTDLTLTVMGLHHFHLGDKIENSGKRKGLIRGTKSILFIKFEDDAAYLIDILSHEINQGFLNRRLLHIIYNNWPQLLEQYRIDRMNISNQEITDDEFAMLIQNQLNIPFSPENGVSFFLPGLLTTGNTDSENEWKITTLLRDLEEIKLKLEISSSDISNYIKIKTRVSYNILRFSIKIRNGYFVIQNENTGLFFTLDSGEICEVR